jgi:ribA/ribD-fused uncharacterized protein
MRTTDTHVYFYGGDCCLSNWHTTKDQFEYRGKLFQNSEQAFMYRKAIIFKDNEIAEKILLTGDPREVKLLGRQVKNFDAAIWDKECYRAMFLVNVTKYKQNPDFLKALLDTRGKILVEASPFDKIWGVGLHWSDDKILNKENWQGKNLLGKVLMDVRYCLS